MSLLIQIKSDQLAARKNREALKASLLTTLLGEAQVIGKNDGNRESTDAEVTAVVKKFIKNLGDVLSATEQQSSAHQKALMEKSILEAYLPTQLTGDALLCIIQDIISEIGNNSKSSMGTIMAKLKSEFDGRYDGKEASNMVKGILI